MTNIRIISLLFGVLTLIISFCVFRGPRWRRSNFFFFTLFSVFLITISLDPDLIRVIARLLSLQEEPRGGTFALLILSNLILWLYMLCQHIKLEHYKDGFDELVRKIGAEQIDHIAFDRIHDKDAIVLIPAYNEEENLRELLKTIPAAVQSIKMGVLVVDDGSTDGTAQAVHQAGFSVVKNKIRRGGGAALRLGYDIIKKTSARFIITMDADGQHDPKELPHLLEPLLEDECDFVIGSRILGRCEKDSLFRFMGLYFFNFVISLMLGIKVTDCSSGYRAFKTDILTRVCLKEDQYHTSELLIDAAKKGVRKKDVPITMFRRKYGISKKGKDLHYGLRFAKTILKTWWR